MTDESMDQLRPSDACVAESVSTTSEGRSPSDDAEIKAAVKATEEWRLTDEELTELLS